MFESDDEDFSFSPSSKLSEIFNSSIGTEASLNYKAPKQPRPQEDPKTTQQATNTQTRTPSSSVILATPVNLWKLENGSNVAMGKYMLAIIGYAGKEIFQIILYQDATKILVRETLGSSMSFHKYPNHFVAFYDGAKQLWNVNFNSLESFDNFLQQASKYNSVIVDKDEDPEREQSKGLVKLGNTETLAVEEKLSSKQKILSKISKVGQQILPKTLERTNSSELSDSETESSCSDQRLAKPVIAPRKFKRASSNYEKSVAPIAHENLANNNFLMPNHQMVQSGLVYSQPLPEYGLSSFIMAQNAELKANLAEINAKLNNVIISSGNNSKTAEEKEGSFTTKIKCQNLKIDNLSSDLEKCRKALQRTQTELDEKCQELAKQQSSSTLLHNAHQELQALQGKAQELEDLQEELLRKDEQLAIYNSRLQGLELDYKESELKREALSRECKELKDNFEKMEQLSRQPDRAAVSLKKEQINALVKEAMSEAFRNITEGFEKNEKYDLQIIQGVVSTNLKKTYFSLIDSLVQESEGLL